MSGLKGSKNWNRSYKGAVASGKSRGNLLLLTEDQWLAKTKICFYCGDSIIMRTGTKLDRIDNSIGYTNENTVGCCGQCNIAKNDYTQEEFQNWIKKVYNTLKYKEEKSEELDWSSIWD